MRIGMDFDNTIVCYDDLFPAVARDQRLVPPDLPRSKESVRDFLRKEGREEDWTRLQGIIYGSRLKDAVPFPGVERFVAACTARKIVVFVISHKTRFPVVGPPVDLHAAAGEWLSRQGAYNAWGLGRDRVFFEPTKEEKLRRIETMGCDYFIDDLPEFLGEPAFPRGAQAVLFDPKGTYAAQSLFRRATSWDEIGSWLLR